MHRKRKMAPAVAVGVCMLLAASVAVATECEFDLDNHKMVLQGDCETETTIFVPDGWTLEGRLQTITATESTPGAWVGPIIQNGGGWATVQRVLLAADNLACSCKEGADGLQGIRFDGASGRVQFNMILGVKKSDDCFCDEGHGIVISNPPFDGSGGDCESGGCVDPTQVQVEDNIVSNYGRTGILANGNVVVDVHKNTVRGSGPIDYIAQNGIQVSYGATGKVGLNTVSSNLYQGPYSSTGILVFESDEVRVEDNTLLSNQNGVVVESWCSFAPSADDNVVHMNIIDGAEWGVSVSAVAWDPPWSTCSASADGNRVTLNRASTDVGQAGIFLGAYCACDSCGFAPTSQGTSGYTNWIYGFDFDIWNVGGTPGACDASGFARSAAEESGSIPISPADPF